MISNRKKCIVLINVIGLTIVLYLGIDLLTYSGRTAASETDLYRRDSILITSQTITVRHGEPPYHDFIGAVTARADADRYIILAMVDEAFVDMAINFYEASLQEHHVDNFLFVGVGRRTCRTMWNMSIPCVYYADDPSAGEASSFRQRDFVRKMNIRTDMILEALAANFTVVHTDIDVAFLNNPLSEIKVT